MHSDSPAHPSSTRCAQPTLAILPFISPRPQTSLVSACEALPMTFSARQQNDAAEFLMLLMDHLEERLKGTKQVDTGRGGGAVVRGGAWRHAWSDWERGITGCGLLGKRVLGRVPPLQAIGWLLALAPAGRATPAHPAFPPQSPTRHSPAGLAGPIVLRRQAGSADCVGGVASPPRRYPHPPAFREGGAIPPDRTAGAPSHAIPHTRPRCRPRPGRSLATLAQPSPPLTPPPHRR